MLRGQGYLCFGFVWNIRRSSAWPAAEGTDARLEAVTSATRTPGYAGNINLVQCLVIRNCLFRSS
jgi:hypothetical protein